MQMRVTERAHSKNVRRMRSNKARRPKKSLRDHRKNMA